MTSNTLTIIGWVVCDLRRSCRLARIKIQIRIYSPTCQVVCNRYVSQMVGWDLLNETESVPSMICETCQVSQSPMGHNSDHYILPPPSFLRVLVEKERMDPIFWIVLSIAAGQEGGKRAELPDWTFQLSLQDKDKRSGSHWRIASYLCAFNALSWLSDCHTASPISMRDILAAVNDVLGIRATTWIFC